MNNLHLTTVQMTAIMNGTVLNDKPFFVDHITVGLMKVLYKLSLADQFVVTEKREEMWDYDSMSNIQDLVGYNLWYTE